MFTRSTYNIWGITLVSVKFLLNDLFACVSLKEGLFGPLFDFLEISIFLRITIYPPRASVDKTTLCISFMAIFWNVTSPIVQTCMKFMCTTFFIILFRVHKTQIWTWSNEISNIVSTAQRVVPCKGLYSHLCWKQSIAPGVLVTTSPTSFVIVWAQHALLVFDCNMYNIWDYLDHVLNHTNIWYFSYWHKYVTLQKMSQLPPHAAIDLDLGSRWALMSLCEQTPS